MAIERRLFAAAAKTVDRVAFVFGKFGRRGQATSKSVKRFRDLTLLVFGERVETGHEKGEVERSMSEREDRCDDEE